MLTLVSNDIVREKRSVTADTALRLARYFGNSAEFWMGLQTDYDLRKAEALRQGHAGADSVYAGGCLSLAAPLIRAWPLPICFDL